MESIIGKDPMFSHFNCIDACFDIFVSNWSKNVFSLERPLNVVTSTTVSRIRHFGFES